MPTYNSSTLQNTNRRKFRLTMGMGLGSGLLLAKPQHQYRSPGTNADWTVGQVMDLFIKEVPGAPFEKTVDTLKADSRDTVVTAIVTTMFPTLAVIQKAIALGSNFIIVHEPTYYSGDDETNCLADSEVYQYKAQLLKKHKISIWRNHDYIHSLQRDGVLMGVLQQLGWSQYYKPGEATLQLPSTTVRALIRHVKEKIGVSALRYTGDLSQPCRKILVMPGHAGGKRQIEMLMKEKPDVLICGEVTEWTTPEYVRDAIGKGDKLALIVIGHSASEEAGSEFMANWLNEKIPAIQVMHVPSGNSLAVI